MNDQELITTIQKTLQALRAERTCLYGRIESLEWVLKKMGVKEFD